MENVLSLCGRFVPHTENVRNRRNTIMVDFEGRKRRLSDLSEEYGMTHKVVASRVERGWDILEALTTPKKERFGGKQKKNG